VVGLGAMCLLSAMAAVRCLTRRDFHGITPCSVVTCVKRADSAAAEPLLAPEHGPHHSAPEALAKTRCLWAKTASSVWGWM